MPVGILKISTFFACGPRLRSHQASRLSAINKLKQHWLDTLVDKDDIFAVFDDRQQVVDMWRKNGLTTFQVADGDF